MSALDTLRAATGIRKAVTMCTDGALQAEWDQALAALDEAGQKDESLAKEALGAAVDHLDSLRDGVKASEVTYLFASDGLPWTEYLQMQADHAPRKGNALDSIRGFNVDTFFPALIRRTCVSVSSADSEPEPVPDDVWDSLLGTAVTGGRLNLKQVNTLADAAHYVMNGENRVPPSARSLLTSQDFGASLAQPSPGTSAPSDSGDGSPSTSPASAAPTQPALTT